MLTQITFLIAVRKVSSHYKYECKLYLLVLSEQTQIALIRGDRILNQVTLIKNDIE